MELKTALKDVKKIIIGSKETIKAIQLGNIKEVFVSSNFPASDLKRLENSTKINNFNINKLKINSEELGAKCRCPYSVIIVGLLR